MTNDREELITSLRRAEAEVVAEAREARAELAAASAALADAQRRLAKANQRITHAASGAAVEKLRAALARETPGYLELRAALAARENEFIREANRLIGHGRQVAEAQRQEIARAIVSLPALLFAEDYEAKLAEIRVQFELPAPVQEQETVNVG